MSFSKLGLPAHLLRAIEAEKFTKPTPIQEKAIPAALSGRDVLGIAQTGSGKTASYVLPLLAKLETQKAPKNRHVDFLIVVPTRELAIQVADVCKTFSSGSKNPIKSLAVYGGVSINPQMIQLQGVRILIATPGRLLELIDSKAVQLSAVQALVLDEADKLLNLGFKEELNGILDLLPRKRQNLLFSATLSPEVRNVKELLLHNPQVVQIEAEEVNIDLIQQSAYLVAPERKGPLLRHLINSKNLEQVLIFTSTVRSADHVVDKLMKNGIDARATHRKKSQGARTEALEDFKSGEIRVLVATDLLSRGIDIEFLPCVINYELPRSPKDYVHRIGRTGRAENPGEAISLITEEDLHHFKVIQKKMKKWVKLTYSQDMDF